jgi:hypothetical protein
VGFCIFILLVFQTKKKQAFFAAFGYNCLLMSNIIKKHLKKSGLLVLDAHLHSIDILLTARYLNKTYQSNVNMAIVGYVFHMPLVKQVLRWFGHRYKINFLPVYRKEELDPKGWDLKFFCSFYPKNLDLETRKKANRNFIQKALELCHKPGEVVLAAPYGGITTLTGRKVKNGIKKLLLNNSWHLTSITRWHFSKMQFKTHFGKIARFKSPFSEKRIENRIQKEFAHLPLPTWLYLLKNKFFKPKAFLKIPIS